jgi:hypothetical protein
MQERKRRMQAAARRKVAGTRGAILLHHKADY